MTKDQLISIYNKNSKLSSQNEYIKQLSTSSLAQALAKIQAPCQTLALAEICPKTARVLQIYFS